MNEAIVTPKTLTIDIIREFVRDEYGFGEGGSLHTLDKLSPHDARVLAQSIKNIQRRLQLVASNHVEAAR